MDASAGVSIPLSVRADRRATQADKRVMAANRAVEYALGAVVWSLELDPANPTWIHLRNSGRTVAWDVSVKPNLGIGVVNLPHTEVVEPGDRRFIALSEAEDVVKLSGSITVTWRLTYGNGPFKESKVSTTDVKREAVTKQTKRPIP